MIFKSIFNNIKVSHLAETQGCPLALAQVLRITQLYQLPAHSLYIILVVYLRKIQGVINAKQAGVHY